MDPFSVLNPFLHELVLQHFSGKDVLNNLSTVSPAWNEIVGSSKVCMSKVKFSYQVWRHQQYSSTKVFSTAADGCRRYQNVIIDLGLNDDLDQFWRFIKSCSEWIVTMKVENVRTTGNVDGFNFCNLETFRAFGIDETSLDVFLSSTKNLQDLFIFTNDNTAADPRVINTIVSCLKRNDKLKDLYFKNANLLEVFSAEFPVSFKLKSLKLMTTAVRSSMAEQIEENLLKFLDNQSPSLETFFFEFSNVRIVEHAFNELPMLKSIGLLDFPSIHLKRNKKITNLDIPNTENDETIRKFINATPNLESLFVGLATDELIEYLAWNFMKLRSLNFKMISIDAEENYEKMKNEHPEINQNIDIWDHETGDWD